MGTKQDNRENRRSIFAEWLHPTIQKTGVVDTRDYVDWLEFQLWQTRHERDELLAALKELVDNETMCTIHWEVMNPIKQLINKIENK